MKSIAFLQFSFFFSDYKSEIDILVFNATKNTNEFRD